jgi:hypothetical protein
MSSYGPQGGPYPGQPQDQWPGGEAYGQYGEPSDPWGDAEPPHTGDGFDEPQHPGAAMPPGDVWGPAQAPSRRGGSGLLLGAAVALVLMLIGGGAAWYLLAHHKPTTVTNGPTDGPSGGPSASAPPSATPSTPPSSKGVAGPNADTRAAKAGDCLLNKGTEQVPDLRKVPCAAETYQVLKRVNGTSDKAKCDGTPNLTDWYFYDNSDDSQDFVLCLRKR